MQCLDGKEKAAKGMCKICSGRTDLKYKFFHRQCTTGKNKTMQPRCNAAVLQQGWIVLYRGMGEEERKAFVCAFSLLEMPNFHKENLSNCKMAKSILVKTCHR